MPEDSNRGASQPPGREAVTRTDLFVVSFLSLFLEITMIRWLPSQVRVLS
jgi:hypothetical protein